MTDIRNQEPEASVGDIFKIRFTDAKDNLGEKIKNDGLWLGFV